MNEFFIESNEQDYVVRIEEGAIEQELRGSVYPIQRWVKSDDTNKKGWSYTSFDDHSLIDELNGDCRVLYEFIFCWRGVWQGRIYHKDEEYWSEELIIMADIWNQLEKELKRLLMEKGYGEE